MNVLRKFMFARFLVVGVINTAVGLSTIYFLFNILALNYWFSTGIGNIIGGICSYVLNKKYTFQAAHTNKRSIVKFIFVNIAAYFAAYYLGYLLINIIQQYEMPLSNKFYENVSILIASGLYTIFNYFGHKYFTFTGQAVHSHYSNHTNQQE